VVNGEFKTLKLSDFKVNKREREFFELFSTPSPLHPLAFPTTSSMLSVTLQTGQVPRLVLLPSGLYLCVPHGDYGLFGPC
jgi:hypothetical protein